ncbi:carbohydrate kinase family protein [Clavibacter tessellarius]|uniref:carbohydrate kinase family protein n=1 Tax=Clavibacter tessellarius TaxID=31965 RepID=UPI0032490A7F
MPADPRPERPAGLLVVGQLFADVVFGDLPSGPRPGHEIWTSSFGHGPGGIANFAVAGARLGVPTVIAAAVGVDPFSRLVRAEPRRGGGRPRPPRHAGRLGAARHRVARLRRRPRHGHGRRRLPAHLRRTRAGRHPGRRRGARAPGSAPRLLGRPRRRGRHRRVRRRRLGPVRALGPGHPRAARRVPRLPPQRVLEASAYTGTDSAVEAARALGARVPLSVVTSGSRGVVAVDSARGEEVVRPPLAVRAVDATGAGDVFGASLAASARAPWSLTERVDFACLVAGITVTRPGGAAGAPRLDELVPWLRAHPEAAEPGRYDYLADALSRPDADRLLA